MVFDESNAFSKETNIKVEDDVGLEKILNNLKLKDKSNEVTKVNLN